MFYDRFIPLFKASPLISILELKLSSQLSEPSKTLKPSYRQPGRLEQRSTCTSSYGEMKVSRFFTEMWTTRR